MSARTARLATLLISVLLAPAAATAADGQPLTLTICGGDGFMQDKTLDEKLLALRRMGATSIQTYIYWSQVEKTPGKFDWSAYDAEVRMYQKAGLKWVPFVVFGPWYLTPEHVRQDPQITMYRCLEHGRDSLIPSLWSPRTREQVRRYLKEFADHYRPMGVLESVNIGITGDYGEAIYSVIGNWPGSYHSHQGFWAGDELAAADFRRHAQRLYPAGIAALNAAWKSNYPDFAAVRPFLPARAPSERAWQEFLAWYRGAMTEYSDFCLEATRGLFPDEDIYLCTGGDMAAEHGSDFFDQARVAAKHRAGLRITNEGSSFPFNVRYTRMVSTACRHYGAYFGHEPASVVTAAGVVGRVFNAVTAGANQLFSYYGSEVIDPSGPTPRLGPNGVNLQRYRAQLNMTTPIIETAVYHANPSSQQMLSLEVSQAAARNYGELLSDLRRFVDYDLVNDRLVQECALDKFATLIVAGAQVMDARTTERIEQWVKRGGLLFVLASRPVDWDGQTARFDALTGFTAATDEVDGIANEGIVIPRPDVLPSIASLKGVVFTRGYTNVTPDAEVLLAYNYTGRPAVAWRRKLGAGTVYAYFGSMDMKQNEASWIVTHQMPLRYMRDAFQAAIADKVIRQAPASLHLGAPDVYKVMTTSGLWILNMGEQPRAVETAGQSVTVPALDIVHLAPAAK